MKWVLEYSKEQNQYHIQSLKSSQNMIKNGYEIIDVFDSEKDAYKALNNRRKIFYEKAKGKTIPPMAT